jgi:hypothetical protein
VTAWRNGQPEHHTVQVKEAGAPNVSFEKPKADIIPEPPPKPKGAASNGRNAGGVDKGVVPPKRENSLPWVERTWGMQFGLSTVAKEEYGLVADLVGTVSSRHVEFGLGGMVADGFVGPKAGVGLVYASDGFVVGLEPAAAYLFTDRTVTREAEGRGLLLLQAALKLGFVASDGLAQKTEASDHQPVWANIERTEAP